jgi:myosin heavy subunit
MEMKTIITACCPYINLEKVLLILQQAGLKVEGDAFARLHDKLFGSSGTINPLQIDHSLLQGSIPEENIAGIISEAEKYPLVLADNRCLWLLDFWTAKFPEAKFLLFYTSAESALASACLQEIAPQQALENWQAACRQLLNFQRCHRRQAVLLNTDAAIRQPQELINICRQIGLTLEDLPQKNAQLLDQTILERYLGHHLIANRPEIQSLQTELEASAQPLNYVTPLEFQPLELFKIQSQNLATQRSLQQELEAAIKKVTQKNEQLLKQIQHVQDELEQIFSQKQKLEQQAEKDQVTHSQQQIKLEQVQQAHQALDATTKELSQENELLLLQLHHVQEELESIFLQKQQLEQQAAKDQVARKEKQAQINQLTQARDEQAKLYSQQQTRLEQVQQAHQVLEATTEEVIQENEELLLQLHQVQEELEQTFLQRKQLERTTKQHIEITVNEKNIELQKVKDELLNKEREVEKYRKRAARLKQTVSWKITSPIRAIANPFNKSSKDQKNIKDQIKLLRTCGHFDEAWYTATNEDVVKDGYDPVEHYVLYGAAEGRDPSPVFNTRRYLEINPDVAEAGMNPLFHYAKYGMEEDRSVDSSK